MELHKQSSLNNIWFAYFIFYKNILFNNFGQACAQPAFTCSKLTIETPEQEVKYAQG